MSRGTPSPNQTVTRVIVGVLLIAPFVALLWVPSYEKVDPRLGGIPYFYWYQLLWVIITALLIWIAYMLTRDNKRGSDD